MSVRRILNAYSSIITKNIALFLALGVLTILFSENGWFPDETMQDFGVLLNDMVIPLFLAYYAGQKMGQSLGQPVRNNMGGIAGVLVGCCMITHQRGVSMLLIIIMAAAAGYLSSWVFNRIESHFPGGFVMMGRNLITVVVGLTVGILTSTILLPAAWDVNRSVFPYLEAVCSNSYLFLANIVIEPLKVLFLNNTLNHGILIPLGLTQMKEMGSSMLFLMETNPGPGLGILFAYWLMKKDDRNSLLTLMAAEFFGGIHELYFPYVLLDLRLMAAVIAGGVCGSFCFSAFGAGTVGAVSPGSVLTILMMAPMQHWAGVLTGIVLSAVVSGGLAMLILKHETADAEKDVQMMEERKSMGPVMEPNISEQKPDEFPQVIQKIFVVCDAGLGSSAMGAALLRKQLKAEGIEDMVVRAAAADDIPQGGDLIICQKDFYEKCLKQKANDLPYIYTVEQLAHRAAYSEIVQRICSMR